MSADAEFDRAMADYAEWSGLDLAKLNHPAGKGIAQSVEVQAHQEKRS